MRQMNVGIEIFALAELIERFEIYLFGFVHSAGVLFFWTVSQACVLGLGYLGSKLTTYSSSQHYWILGYFSAV